MQALSGGREKEGDDGEGGSHDEAGVGEDPNQDWRRQNFRREAARSTGYGRNNIRA